MVNGNENGHAYASGGKKVTLITAIVLLAVIIFNVLFTILADADLWYIDLSEVRYTAGESTMYTLSDSCKDLIRSEVIPMIESANDQRVSRGEEKIKLNIFFCSDKDVIESNDRLRYVSITARSLEKEFSESIDVQYLNIRQNPSSVQRFKTTSASTIHESDVIVEFGSEYLIGGISAFFYQDDGAERAWAYNGEQKLSAMILSLTRAEAPICAVTVNHGESLFSAGGKVKDEYSTFIKLIGGAGYDIVYLDLEKDEIPENCRMMITFDPQSDFKAYGSLGENGVSEIDKLDRYLENSNAFFYICSRETPEHKNLEEYLSEWGVAIARADSGAGIYENYVVRDSQNCTDIGRGDVVIGKYGEQGVADGLTSDLQSQSYPPMVLFGKPTAIKPSSSYVKNYVFADPENGVEAYSYYSYFHNGVSRIITNVFSSYDTASAYIGDEVYEIAADDNLFGLMTVTKEARIKQETNYTSIDRSSYVLSLASTDFLTNDALDSAAYGNTDVILSALRRTGGEAVPANVALKGFYIYDIDGAENNPKYTATATTWLICLTVIPAVVTLCVGTVVVVRRRKR
ncbi:MAG: Gldg family protein [Clostridia bacterium]|nr:Gldg family protein [Clostridia bacterium]